MGCSPISTVFYLTFNSFINWVNDSIWSPEIEDREQRRGARGGGRWRRSRGGCWRSRCCISGEEGKPVCVVAEEFTSEMAEDGMVEGVDVVRRRLEPRAKMEMNRPITIRCKDVKPGWWCVFRWMGTITAGDKGIYDGENLHGARWDVEVWAKVPVQDFGLREEEDRQTSTGSDCLQRRSSYHIAGKAKPSTIFRFFQKQEYFWKMGEFASAIAGAVVESLMVPVKKHLGYLFLSTEYVRKLDAGMKQLEGTSVDVKNHKDTNDVNTLEVPARVPSWLDEVAKIKGDAETISSNENGCFNIKARYQMGRNAWKTTQEIERLLQEGVAFTWTDAQKPLGRVNTRSASTSALPSGGGIGDDFKSRDTTFKDALKFLEKDQKTQVIALCGMGGVGKTTMMEQLKKVVEDKKKFDWIVKVVIGKQPNWYSIQKAVAENLGNPLTEEVETTRADRLRKRFEETLKTSEKGILVILDDVWEMVELRYVGLSPLPNGVKLLLTSRNEDFCRTIAVQGNLELQLLKVDVLQDEEARNLFCKITNISKESDPELYQIGGDIVKKCSYLPLAITLIAPTLISEETSIWKDRLGRLRNKDLHQNVRESIKISYDYLKDEEEKEIFMLCGLFPEDSNIPIEELARYTWGLKLLNGVSTVEDGRNRIKSRVSNLRKANLLIDGDYPGSVKMHDLVLAFVLATVSKGDHASIINHGDMSNWSSEGIRESCKRISLTCRGMCEFPQGFKCPNLSLLKLMHGDDSFKFPQGFYENTEKLQVIAYEKMRYPLLPRSLQCSTNLRVLCLHGCSLMFDFSFIGYISNLEVLSITNCFIRKLPSTIGHLKKLKVLDLTGCFDLLIDDGVLKRLVNLEELYMIAYYHRAIRFTDANVDELVGCSKNLTALAIEFTSLPKNISFKKLERFKISLGGYLKEYNDLGWDYTFENTLKLVTDKCELLDSRMNELFDRTEVLYLQVKGVNDLGDGLAESLHHRPSSFYNLRVLDICKCVDLRYLFTVGVANGLKKLERLTISSCPVLETVVDGNKGGIGVIKFQALKFLSLGKLPELKSLCNAVDVIELPQLKELELNGLPKFTSIYPLATSSLSSNISERQSFFNEEAVPNLEKVRIFDMENLKEIWPCNFHSSKEANACKLKEFTITRCDSLVNLFPSNPMSLLYHLEELRVKDCGSIEVLFNIDLGCVGQTTEEVNACKLREFSVEGCNSLVNLFPSNPMSLLNHLENLIVKDCGSIEVLFNIDLGCVGQTTEEVSSCLRSICVMELGNLREVWRIKGADDAGLTFSGFQAIETLEINRCKRFRNVFTPTTINFDMKALTRIGLVGCGGSERDDELVKSSQEQEINVMSNEEISEVDDTILKVAFPSYLLHTCHNLHELCIGDSNAADVFEIESPINRELAITPHKQQPRSSFHNLTNISLRNCNKIKYLFSPLMVKLLSNLKNVTIWSCDVIEEVVSSRDYEDERFARSTNTSTNLVPHLDELCLSYLPKLKRIGGGNGAKGGSIDTSTTTTDKFELPHVNDLAWSLCQYSRTIEIEDCETLQYVIPSYVVGQMQKLENLTISSCESLVEVFETQGFNINGGDTITFDDVSGGNDDTMVIQRMKKINVPQLSNLKELVIHRCDLLQHVFTFSTLESLVQLEKLRISDCKAMKVIVKEDNIEQTTISSKVVIFPRLKSIVIRNLPNLIGFFLGKNEFQWPYLDEVLIDGCPQITMFTSGCSLTPKLKYVHTKLGKHSLGCGLNFPVMAATLCEGPFSSLDSTNSCATTSKRTPWSFHNLIEMDVKYDPLDVKKIIPSNELPQLQQLEKIHVTRCWLVEEVFEALEGTDSNDQLQSVVVKFPKLREVELIRLRNLKYVWKNNPWMVLEFPNLTKVSIHESDRLEYVFSSSMVGSLLQLQDLHVRNCRNIEVIVKEANVVGEEEEEEYDAILVNEIIMLPSLKSLELIDLPSLKGFCLGKEAFSWPSLDTLKISDCPAIRVFTREDLSTPELRVIDTSFGRCELGREEDINSFMNTKQQEGLEL
ncbi:hypothetical protein L6452_08000 [Arctium lappa]|uniref:Uncharacterized protein n=1 Tax=Arctium lappa TaxID=4217 RepID=A0ACB9DG15_ARCLA|nr:hypothetical protein L6452_08000 [Arctium lappa]